ncbi:MAG: hypothetical protein J6J97_05220 [Akkermansia sp.]|nr:hypothetical protein [Akkermansia sp.]
MIPEIENKKSALFVLRRNLHLAMRRRTWRFKRNARLAALLPQEPVRRSHTVWACAVPLLTAFLVLRA